MQSLLRGSVLATALGGMAIGLYGCGGGGDDGPPTTTTTMTTTTTNTNCLCVFDIDRTLTASQTLDCPNTTVQPDIKDNAYDGGTLKLSQLAGNMHKTFCSKCYHSVVTRGDASGDKSKERGVMLANVVGPKNYTLTEDWQMWQAAPGAQTQDPAWKSTGSIAYFVNDGHKHECVKSIVGWFLEQGILIQDYKVHFFDDRDDNVKPFEGTGYNAHQISCAARDPKIGNIGKCGATTDEIVESGGGVITLCGQSKTQMVV